MAIKTTGLISPIVIYFLSTILSTLIQWSEWLDCLCGLAFCAKHHWCWPTSATILRISTEDGLRPLRKTSNGLATPRRFLQLPAECLRTGAGILGLIANSLGSNSRNTLRINMLTAIALRPQPTALPSSLPPLHVLLKVAFFRHLLNSNLQCILLKSIRWNPFGKITLVIICAVPFVWSISVLGKGFLTISDTNQRRVGITLLSDTVIKCGRMQKLPKWIWMRLRAIPNHKPLAREGIMSRPQLSKWWAHCSWSCFLAMIVPITLWVGDIAISSSQSRCFVPMSLCLGDMWCT